MEEGASNGICVTESPWKYICVSRVVTDLAAQLAMLITDIMLQDAFLEGELVLIGAVVMANASV